MGIVYGIAGFRDFDGRFSFRPKIPSQLESVSFSLTIRSQLLDVEVASDCVTYSLREGRGLVFHHEDQEVRLSPGSPVSRHAHVVDESEQPELHQAELHQPELDEPELDKPE
jgi:alpha,alpha-trehalose phosphorylase